MVLPTGHTLPTRKNSVIWSCWIPWNLRCRWAGLSLPRLSSCLLWALSPGLCWMTYPKEQFLSGHMLWAGQWHLPHSLWWDLLSPWETEQRLWRHLCEVAGIASSLLPAKELWAREQVHLPGSSQAGGWQSPGLLWPGWRTWWKQSQTEDYIPNESYNIKF